MSKDIHVWWTPAGVIRDEINKNGFDTEIKKFQDNLEDDLYFSDNRILTIRKPSRQCGSSYKIYEYITSRFKYEENYNIVISAKTPHLLKIHQNNIFDIIFNDIKMNNIISIRFGDLIYDINKNSISFHVYNDNLYYLRGRMISEVFLLDFYNSTYESMLPHLVGRLIVERD